MSPATQETMVRQRVAFLVVGRYPAVATLLVVFVLAQFAERMLEANWVLFTGYQFAWGAAAVGISFAWVGVLFVFTQGVLVRFVVPKLGEWRTLTWGLAIAAVCMSTISFATQGWMLYAIIVPYVLGWGPDRTEEYHLECPRCHAEFRSGHHDGCPIAELVQEIEQLLEES